jgi:hypothetical protein
MEENNFSDILACHALINGKSVTVSLFYKLPLLQLLMYVSLLLTGLPIPWRTIRPKGK